MPSASPKVIHSRFTGVMPYTMSGFAPVSFTCVAGRARAASLP